MSEHAPQRMASPAVRYAASSPPHLSVDPDATGSARWTPYADVLASTTSLPAGAARRRVAVLLARHPGCLVAAVPVRGGACCLSVRGGPLLIAPRGPSSTHVLASALHDWLVAGGRCGDLHTVTLYADGRPVVLHVVHRRPAVRTRRAVRPAAPRRRG
ncbi:hypothetical protein [Streptomyces sp. ODS28]|uniref:hypothetical protein n=1 Tax=Streptomyces sp. ODS28 TaxID=3136688 RepID=UPI0031E4EF0D